MISRITLLLLLLNVTLVKEHKAQDIHYEWMAGAGAGTMDQGNSITADKDGNAITVGSFHSDGTPSRVLTFIPSALHPALPGVASMNVYAIKTNPAGDVLWAKNFGGGGGNDGASSVVTDDAGNIYITGMYSDALDFGTVQLSSKGERDIFIAKLAPNGDCIWAHGIGGDDKTDEWGVGIGVDRDANVYVTGQLTKGQVDMNPGSGTALLEGGIFILKLDQSGDFIWAKNVSGSVWLREFQGDVLAAGADGSVHITGYFSGTVDFDPAGGGQTLTQTSPTSGPFPTEDGFTLKLDTDGIFRWVAHFGGPSYARGEGITVDTDGYVYTVGSFASQIDLDPSSSAQHIVTSNTTNHDVFISKLDSAGRFVWGKSFGSNATDYGFGIAVDKQGAVYTTGNTGNNADYNPGTNPADTFFIARGGAFIVKLDRAGDFTWAKVISGVGGSTGGVSVAVSDHFEVYTTGLFQGRVDFDPGPGSDSINHAGGNSSIFIHKMSCPDRLDTVIQVNTCGSFTWGDSTYTASGTHHIHSLTDMGCESNVTLNLTLNSIEPPIISSHENRIFVEDVYAGYQWFLNGDSIKGATSAALDVYENGDYTIVVTSAEGCTATAAYYVNNVKVHSLSGEYQISVYPNPVTDVLHIRSDRELTARILLPDGRLVLQTTETGRIQLSHLAAGLYILNLTDSRGTVIHHTNVIKR